MSGSTTPRPELGVPFQHYQDDAGSQVPVVYVHPDSGVGGGGGAAADREFLSLNYTATSSGTGYTSGDSLVRMDVYDVSSTPTLVTTIWFNITTAAAISAPTSGHVAYVGPANAASESTLAAINTKIPAKGQTTKSGSTPVTLASDQEAVKIKEEVGATATVSAVALTATRSTLVAADANRRGLRVGNPSGNTAKIGLTTTNSGSYADCPIQLSPGDMWVETLCPGVTWYACTDTGSASVNIQVVS